MPDLRISDFSGGETDRFRDNQPIFSEKLSNLYITENKGIVTRPGFEPVVSSDQRPFGTQRVDKVFHHVTRRHTNASGSDQLLQKFETFIVSNEAVRRNSDVDPTWKVVENAEGNNTAKFFTATQGHYTRINDNEFVLICSQRYALKFFRVGFTGEWKYVSLGLPFYKNAIVTENFIAGTNDWGYALVLKHTYETYDEGTGFIDKIVRSEPVFTSVITNVATSKITLPEFSITTKHNYEDNEGDIVDVDSFYDFANIVWELYRTVNNGSIFYKVTEYTNLSGLVVIDSKSDANLVSGEKLYTTGGVVSNGMASDRVLFTTFANNALWLATNNRVFQSKVGIFDAVPGSFVFAVREGETITGISTMDVFPIVFTNQGAYRIEGLVDDLGNGTHRVRTISEEYGALSNKTTVKAGNKIFFLSDDGIYMTNGYTATKVSDEYNDRYCAFTEIEALRNPSVPMHSYRLAEGSYDEKNRRVSWFYATEGELYFSKYFTVHLKYKHKTGYAITSGDIPYEATSTDAVQGSVYLTTLDGSVIRQGADRLSDTNIAAGQPSLAVVWEYISGSMSFGSTLFRKWIPRIILHLKNHTDITFDVLSDTEETGDWRYHNGVKETSSQHIGQYILKRWTPKGRIRATFKRFRLTNSLLSGTKPNDEKIELLSMTIAHTGSGEGHTESGPVP